MNDGLTQEQEDAVRRFAGVAKRFCAFVETGGGDALDTLVEARRVLAAVYAAAMELPDDVQLSDALANAPERERNAGRPEGWVGFGAASLYWEVYDPYVEEDLVCGSLDCDFIETYEDLLDGFHAYDRGELALACFEWRFAFDTHWGDHAVDALRALQRAWNGNHGEGIAGKA